MGDTATIAYCGPAAVPGDLLVRWNFDPLLMAALAALAIVIASGRVANTRAGWTSLLLMATIFISPLCALSSALFSARVLHHVLLIAAVAPLLALAFPVQRQAAPADFVEAADRRGRGAGRGRLRCDRGDGHGVLPVPMKKYTVSI